MLHKTGVSIRLINYFEILLTRPWSATKRQLLWLRIIIRTSTKPKPNINSTWSLVYRAGRENKKLAKWRVAWMKALILWKRSYAIDCTWLYLKPPIGAESMEESVVLGMAFLTWLLCRIWCLARLVEDEAYWRSQWAYLLLKSCPIFHLSLK